MTGPASAAQLLQWVEAYGAHTASYVLLEGGKSIVTVTGVDGFLAYERRAGIPIIAGDPICHVDEASLLLRALRRRSWPLPVVSYATRPEMLPAFRRAGFDAVPIGAEPIFDPRNFSLAGGARATVRAAVNHATRDGLEVVEHDPMTADAASRNAEITAISDMWLQTRGGGELGFLLGQPVLDRPTRKRYFVAQHAGRMEAFLVCDPIPVRRGWYLDVTRRRPDAPRGTMELLTTTALAIFGREGVPMASMGLAPLGMLELGDPIACDSPALRRWLGDAFEQLDVPYDFHNLLRYKTKYAPDSWEPRFLCYSKGNGEHAMRLALRVALWRARQRKRRKRPDRTT